MEDVLLVRASSLAPAIVLSPAPTLNEPYAQLIISQARQHVFHPNEHLSVAYGFKFAPMPETRPAPGFLEAASFALNLDLVGLWLGIVSVFVAIAGVFTTFGSVVSGVITEVVESWETPALIALASSNFMSWGDIDSERLPSHVGQKYSRSTGRRLAALLALGTITLALGSLHLLVSEGNGTVLEHMLDLD